MKMKITIICFVVIIAACYGENYRSVVFRHNGDSVQLDAKDTETTKCSIMSPNHSNGMVTTCQNKQLSMNNVKVSVDPYKVRIQNLTEQDAPIVIFEGPGGKEVIQVVVFGEQLQISGSALKENELFSFKASISVGKHPEMGLLPEIRCRTVHGDVETRRVSCRTGIVCYTGEFNLTSDLIGSQMTCQVGYYNVSQLWSLGDAGTISVMELPSLNITKSMHLRETQGAMTTPNSAEKSSASRCLQMFTVFFYMVFYCYGYHQIT